MERQDLPKIKKIAEVGDKPFKYISTVEKLLQGWDSSVKKTVYLFKTDTGQWGYYDKETQQVIEIDQWKKKAAFINGRWIKMVLYYKIQAMFAEPISFSSWNKMDKKKETLTAKEVLITLTATAFNKLEEQMKGRTPESFYKLSFTTRKKPGGGGNMTFVDNVIWVG